MKNKHTALLLTAIIITGGISTASARGLDAALDTDVSATGNVRVTGISVDASTRANVNARAEDNDTDRATSSRSNSASATGTSMRNSDDNDSSAGSDSDGDRDENTSGVEHRSVVATFVHSLLTVADREGGIGAQVRAIAKAQNDSGTTTVSAMTQIDSRSGLKTFFFGSDYKNLGKIRAEIATTTKTLEQLKALLSSTTNVSDRAELSAQINALQAEQVRVQAYVKAHEDVFSLFGWFNKMFQ